MPTGVRACPLRLAGALLLGTALLGGCGRKTGALTAEEQRRIDAEGLVCRADDLVLRYIHDAGRRDAG